MRDTMMNDCTDFDSWARDIVNRCRGYAYMNNYKFSYASFPSMWQLNIRLMNPHNGKLASFDFDYMNPIDRNIIKTVKYVVDICENQLPDIKTSVDDYSFPEIKNVIFNDPATIVLWLMALRLW